MKLIKTASGKQNLKMSKKEWQSIGKKAGWMKESQIELDPVNYSPAENARFRRQKRRREEEIDGDFDDHMDPDERRLRNQRNKNNGLTDAELNDELEPGGKKR